MGHVGDSRAVLGSKDDGTGDMVAVQLTVDLKPDLPSMSKSKCHICLLDDVIYRL